MTPALFLDRDGVVNQDHGYTYRREDFQFVEGIFSLSRAFQAAGYVLVIVTNQSGVARGYYSEADVVSLHGWMTGEFARQGVRIAAVYHCPHLPMGSRVEYAITCECRKPQPGMILRAQRELGLYLARSVLVGDKESDIEAGVNAGVSLNLKVFPLEGPAPSKAAAVVYSLDAVVAAARERGFLPKEGKDGPEDLLWHAQSG